MKSWLLIVLLFLSGEIYSQSLNAELGFNENYDQTCRAVVCVDEFSYIIKFQKTSSFFSTSTLHKADTTGNIIWSYQITPVNAEYTEVSEMIPSAEGGVYVLGYGMPTCDVGQDCFWYIEKIDSAGSVVWINTWTNNTCTYPYSLSGLSLSQNNELLVNHVDSDSTSYVYTIDNFSTLTDTVQINFSKLSGFCELTGYEFIAYKEDTLHAFDTNGNSTNNIVFSSAIQNIRSMNDSLYVLTLDSVFIFDNNLNVLQGSNVPGDSLYSNIKVTADKIKFISNGIANQTILELNKQLQLQNAIAIPVSINFDTHKDFSDSHFSAGIDFPITLHHTIRYLDYSLSSNQGIPFSNIDIGVSEVDVNQTFLQPLSPPGVYQYQIWASVLVKNYGSDTLNSCRINHRVSMWGICSEVFYTNEFTNLNLAPNDSIWINPGMIHGNVNNFIDTIAFDLCVYTSHPNQITDTIVPNDQFCENIFLGMVGLNETLTQNISIFPNPINDVIHIENPDLINLTMYVYDNLGKVISIESGTNRKYEIDMSKQSKGMYLVRIISKKGEVTKKLIKQ